MLHVRTLGGLRQTADGDDRPLRRKPLALLSYVARRSPSAVPRTVLATLFWGERGEERARQSLRQALLELKQALGERIDIDADTVRVAFRPRWAGGPAISSKGQEQEFERIGSTRSQKIDVRLVAATNRDLETEVSGGRFRRDLFSRLNVFPVQIPPLRDRVGDIPLLVKHFLAQLQRKLGKPLHGVTEESMRRLQAYAWPGNIRELQNVLERACVMATSRIVDIDDEAMPVAMIVERTRSHCPVAA